MTSVTTTKGTEQPAHQETPDRREVVRVVAFSVSVLAVALFALRVSHVVTIPVTYLFVPLLLYPLSQFAQREYQYSPLDVVYLAVLVSGLGGVLAFSSPYPLGFGDVHVHLKTFTQTITGGHLEITRGYVSTSFVALYIVTGALSALGGLSVSTIARGLPIVTFVTLVLVFYHVFVSRFLTRREALLATMLFLFNYGVFRFNVEYRTLNLALVLVLLLLALFLRNVKANRLSPETLGLYTVLTAGLVSAHFATTIMYLVLLTVLTGALLIHRQSLHSVTYLLITGLALFVYVAYIAGSLTGFLLTVQGEFIAAFVLSDSSGTGGGGVAGLTYGQNMFVIEWTIRLLFVTAFGVFVLLWLRKRDQFTTFVIASTVLIGILLVVSAVTGFLLNPGRVLTFFAIPYSVAFAVGMLVVYRFAVRSGTGRVARLRQAAQGPTAQRVTRVVICVLLVLVLVNTVVKFPVDSIGSPEPIRTAGAVDEDPLMHIDEDELTARAFIQQQFGQEDEPRYMYGTPEYSFMMQDFYEYDQTSEEVSVNVRDEYGCDCGFAVVGETNRGHGKSVDGVPLMGSRVYDNGAIEVFELDNWAADNYQWRQQLTAEDSE